MPWLAAAAFAAWPALAEPLGPAGPRTEAAATPVFGALAEPVPPLPAAATVPAEAVAAEPALDRTRRADPPPPRSPAAAAPILPGNSLAELERRYDELRRTVEEQRREIDRLRDGSGLAGSARRAFDRVAAGWATLVGRLAPAGAALRGYLPPLGPRTLAPALAILVLLALVAVLLMRRRSGAAGGRTRILSLAPPAKASDTRPAAGLLIAPEFLTRAIRSFGKGQRRRWAQKMAPAADAPRDLIAAFAADDIEIAEPVLRDSPMLDDTVLLGLVRGQGSPHQRAIAQRHELSPAVADALARTGKAEVVTALLRNRHARIAEATMEGLVAAARHLESYREPLARRADLSPKLAWRLYDHLSDELRDQLRERFEVSRVEAEPAPVAAEPEPAGQPEPPPTPDRLVEPLRRGDVPGFAALLTEMTGLAEERLHRILAQPSGRRLAVICRALEFDRSGFAWIFLRLRKLQSAGRPVAPAELAGAIASYAALTVPAAREILAAWQRGEDGPAEAAA